MGSSLREKIDEWAAEYPAIKNHGWTKPEVDAMADDLWDLLSDQLGAVQEKLMADLEVARHEAKQSRRNELRAVQDLERYILDHSGS